MRVLHVVGRMNRGGIESFLMNVYRHIERSKLQFDFAVHTQDKCDFDDEIEALGGKIYRITPRSKSIIQNNKDWDNLFKIHSDINVVHQHVSSLTYVSPLRIAKKNGLQNRIVHSHNIQAESKLHYAFHLLNSRYIDKYANYYFACSNNAAKWLYGKSKVKSNNIQLVKNAINIENFLFQNDKRCDLRSNLSLNEGEIVIGHVGRFSEQKNHKFLIDIFEKITEKVKNAKLLLVGSGSLEQDIKYYVKEKRLDSNVMFLGNRSDVANIMQAMDIFLLPSLHEGLPLVLVEAQASGLMCFVSSEAVSNEAKITETYKSISLEKNAEHWSNEIIKSLNYKRQDTSVFVRKAGYEIKNEALNLQNFYLNL